VPNLKITAVQGKMFHPEYGDFGKIKKLPGVAHYAEVIEEVALLKYGGQQYIATVKGVPENYTRYTHIDSLVIDGEFMLENEGINYAVVGQGVAYNLGLGLTFIDPIRIFVPKKGKQMSMNMARAINQDFIYPSGIFAVLEEVDSKYVIVPFSFAEGLFESNGQISAVELGFTPKTNEKQLQGEIQEILGDNFTVENKYQQHDLIYKTMESEKWAAYLILVFILVIASFNILGSLSMLIIDKKDDLFILRGMGADAQTIRRIFLYNGWMISFIGALIGSLLGVFVCWIQIEFSIVTLPGAGSFVISAYPVKIVFSDILLVFTAVLSIGFLAAWYPVRFISHKYLLNTNL